MSPTGISLSGGATRPTRAALRAAQGLALLASPIFASMAWVAANDVAPMAHGAAGASILPVDGMTAMYLLMSLFHLPPWLKLVSAAGRPSSQWQKENDQKHAVVSRQE